MLKRSDFSAVIFDMDGLVLDTETGYFNAWQQAASDMGYALSELFLHSLSGLSGTAIREKLYVECGTDFDLVEFKNRADSFWRQHVQQQGIAVKHGFNELLAFILEHDLPYCLATNSPLINALECLSFAGLDKVFQVIISRDQVSQSKPAPDIFLAAANSLGVPIQHCLVLEDSHAGVVAATQAGAIAVFVPSTPTINSETVELCTLMLPDLKQVLQSIRD